MNTLNQLSDSNNPTVINLASRQTYGKVSPLEKIESIFYYVRDQIKFGFPPIWDEVKASETIYHGLGYCNTKATLFVALSRAVGIPARLHFGLIDLRIMHGIMPAVFFPFLPKLGGHSWVEVQLDGTWRAIDSYINDKPLYGQALQRLQKSERPLGYSIALLDGKSSCDFNFGELGFVHMGAVRVDHGTWDDAADYFASDKYIRLTPLQKFALPLLITASNRNIVRLRQARLNNM